MMYFKNYSWKRTLRLVWLSLAFVSLLLRQSPVVNARAFHQVSVRYAPHVDTAARYIGIRERTGRNDGVVVERFLASVGLPRGNSWCAAFVSYCLTATRAAFPPVRSGLARHFVSRRSIRAESVLSGQYQVRRGDLLIWFQGNTIYGHIEMASEDWLKKHQGKSVGGNTNASGSRDGDGVYEQVRTIRRYDFKRIRYITPVDYQRVNEGRR